MDPKWNLKNGLDTEIKRRDHNFPKSAKVHAPKSVSVQGREEAWGLTVWQTNLRSLCKTCCHYHGNGVRCDPLQQLDLPHPGARAQSKSQSCTGNQQKKTERERTILGGTEQTGHGSWKGRDGAAGGSLGENGRKCTWRIPSPVHRWKKLYVVRQFGFFFFFF